MNSADELLALVNKLKQRGSRYSLVDHGISWAAYTEDPSGNGVEIYLDRRKAPGGTKHWGGVSRYLAEGEIK